MALLRPRRAVVLALLAVVVVALVIGDRAAKGYAESAVEASVRREVAQVGAVDASISSFPFVGRLLVLGEVSRFRLTLDDVVGRGVPVAELRLDVDGIRFDRQSLRRGHDVEVTGTDTVRVTARITRDGLQTVLGPAAGPALTLADGASLRIADGRVQLGAGLAIPLPPADLLPCDASATVVHQAIEIQCVSDHLPPIVLDAIGSAALRGG
jgi:hypothetical protein